MKIFDWFLQVFFEMCIVILGLMLAWVLVEGLKRIIGIIASITG